MAEALRILTVLGTRPEIVKLVPVLCALRDDAGVDSRLCHTGQHRDLGSGLLDAFGLCADDTLHRSPAGGLSGLFASLLTGIGTVMDRGRPDCLIVQGDTASAAAAALCAFHRGILVAHVEAGLRSGDLSQPWPEEGYRRTITQLARWHFAPTPAARANLLAENTPTAHVHVTGNTVIDAQRMAREMLRRDPARGAAADKVLARFAGRPFALATVHRREHDAAALRAIADALCTLSRDIAIVLPAHPRPQSRILTDRLSDCDDVAVVPPFDYFAFLRLMDACRIVLTDSGGIQEEAVALGRGVVVLRDVTERGEILHHGQATLVGHDESAILTAARAMLSRDRPAPDPVFGDGRAAQRIVAVLTKEAG
ncbi:UDP-N-acetylglucosamine 2-epimerase (non-hydrolyzing) [uncultured Croceicoccus sp.]|uniref:non-hydrolyzing UDP-N-acetylglucosamine 2-epimerase n=1 Tax=uncultured Croceicoccus sp. TaxID=1295329 RepID=UPI002627EFEE|nr:UDP-N-acetylglucosamine 2-epimerase (non-hydrolyzing) [uncultured Croceicoccus sp.]